MNEFDIIKSINGKNIVDKKGQKKIIYSIIFQAKTSLYFYYFLVKLK